MTVAALMSFTPCAGCCPNCGSNLKKNSLGKVRCSKEGCDYSAIFDQDTGEILSHAEAEARKQERLKKPISRSGKIFWLLLLVFVVIWQVVETLSK